MYKISLFNGRMIAHEKEQLLKKTVLKLKDKEVIPKLVSFVVGNSSGGIFYQNLKKKAGKRVGVIVDVKSLSSSTSLSEILKKIEELNENPDVHGIMVQLPLSKNLKLKTYDIINAIIPSKDVDGMRDDSPYLTPVTKAVLIALKAAYHLIHKPPKVLVVGGSGFEGSKIFKTLKEMDYDVERVDRKTPYLGTHTKKADILISATGHPKLINSRMVKNGSIVVDVGAPYGDVKIDDVIKKASFVTPVPGGIGPVTITCLLENVVEATYDSLKKK